MGTAWQWVNTMDHRGEIAREMACYGGRTSGRAQAPPISNTWEALRLLKDGVYTDH